MIQVRIAAGRVFLIKVQFLIQTGNCLYAKNDTALQKMGQGSSLC